MDRKRALRLRFRRHLRMQKRQVQELGATAEQRLEDDFFKRLERLGNIRRFIVGWVLLMVLLIGSVVAQTRALSTHYQARVPAPGGTYTEGILGAFTNANPLYATDLVDTSVSELLFSGLLTFDGDGRLAGDLAEQWAVDDPGTTYTVTLRPNLTWHDGRPLTAADVVFTYSVIQNPDARSPLYTSWQGIKVAAINARTVTFTLPNVLASFPYSLTNGIVPQHILGATPMTEMRSASFNSTKPVGSGPFMWQALELRGASADKREERIALKAFPHYHAGKPKLTNFVVRTFRSADQLVRSFEKQEVTAAVGLAKVPSELQGGGEMRAYSLPLTAAVMTFFKTSAGVLSDVKVRQALVRAADTNAIVQGLDFPTQPIRTPLLRGQLAYDPAYAQPGHDLAAANAMLDQAGWLMGADGIRHLGQYTLTFDVLAQSGNEYERAARQLAAQWRKAGAKVTVTTAAPGDATFQKALTDHAYDALIYGISLGADPDVFVYWHSSQASVLAPVQLNFSEYKSAVADAALEGGRTRLDPALRTVKYQPFLQAWQNDAPALGLYQPRFLYLTRQNLHGLSERPIHTDVGRFTNVANWQVRETRKTIE